MGYSAEDIEVLPGLEGVRRRPEMYIGPLATPRAMIELIEQALCAAFDDALDGSATLVEVSLGADGLIEISDDGLGMPVEVSPHTGKPACEMLMTELLACRAERRNPEAAKRFCVGGIAVTNALSAWLELEIAREGSRFAMRFERGITSSPLVRRGETDAHGTRLRFLPDPEIFGVARVDARLLDVTLDEIRALVPAARVTLTATLRA